MADLNSTTSGDNKRRILFINDDTQTDDGSVQSPDTSRQPSPMHFDDESKNVDRLGNNEDNAASKDHPPTIHSPTPSMTGSIYYSSPNEPLRQQLQRRESSSAETTPPSVRTSPISLEPSPSSSTTVETRIPLPTAVYNATGIMSYAWDRLSKFISMSARPEAESSAPVSFFMTTISYFSVGRSQIYTIELIV
jgi:hypothetical protein